MIKGGLIQIIPVLEGKHIVNCPFFDQSTVLKFPSSIYRRGITTI
jgi:hypothetical protein